MSTITVMSSSCPSVRRRLASSASCSLSSFGSSPPVVLEVGHQPFIAAGHRAVRHHDDHIAVTQRDGVFFEVHAPEDAHRQRARLNIAPLARLAQEGGGRSRLVELRLAGVEVDTGDVDRGERFVARFDEQRGIDELEGGVEAHARLDQPRQQLGGHRRVDRRRAAAAHPVRQDDVHPAAPAVDIAVAVPAQPRTAAPQLGRAPLDRVDRLLGEGHNRRRAVGPVFAGGQAEIPPADV